MIKINLLPISDADRIEDGKAFFTVLFMVFILVSVVAYFRQRQDVDDLDARQGRMNALQRDRRALQQKVEESKKLEESFSQLKEEVDRQQEVINDLTQNQVSPAGLLSEFSYLLSPPRGDNERENFAQKGWRWSWNPGEVWIERFKEDMRSVRLQGVARTIDDVGEFLNRLNASNHFMHPYLKFTELDRISFPNGQRGAFVRFEIETRVLYGVSDLKKLFDQTGEPLPGARAEAGR